MKEKVRVKATVRGFVQGIGYRYFTVREANNLGLKGYVRNLHDGNVEAVAEGEKDKIDDFILRLKKGPSFSNVSDVDVVWDFYRGEFKNFDIRF